MAKKIEKKAGAIPENAPPGLFINAQYLKDLSFENPNPLDAYKNNDKPDISVNVNTAVKKLPENAFEVTLDLKTEAKKKGKIAFIAEVSYAGIFTLNQVPEWARSSDAKWVGISGRARTVVYNPNTTTEEELPDSMWGFVEPQWKGRIGWAPTNASFQAMVTGMRAVWGEDGARDWLNAIQANEPTVYPKNTPQVAAVAAGEIDVGFVNHYYLFRFLAEEGDDFAARNYHPRSGGPGSVIMVAGAGILESSHHKTNAAKFLEFMLSPVAQQYFAGQTYEYPLVDGVKTSRILVPFDEINHPGLPLSSFADLEGTGNLLRETGILP